MSIIDGQQRIATTTILLASMRDAYRSNDKEQPANSFDTQFLRQHDVVEDDYKRRMRLNAQDDPFYYEFIIGGVQIEPEGDSHEKLKFAKEFFDAKLLSIVLENPSSWLDKLAEITRYLQTQARVVVVETENDADAYTIFETLNDRGANLTIVDLLKNYLFSRAKGEIEAVKSLWFDALSILDEVQAEKEFVSFLRQLWSSYRGITRERDLYRSIKKFVQSSDDSLRFAKQLKDGATYYRAILSPDSEYWNDYPKSTRDHLTVLGGFSLQQVRPLLIAVLSTMGKTQIVSVVKNLTSWGVRGIVAGNTGGGQVEKYFSDAAVGVRAKKVTNTSELMKVLQPIILNDSVFQNAFSSMRVTKNSQARYYLCAIEKHLLGEDDPELILNEDAKKVNLEHILPQKRASGEWATFTDDEATAFAYRLGNMTLLRRSSNQRLGNGPWDKKRLIIGKSELHLNQAISEIEEWDKDVIEERQDDLARLACEVWPHVS